MSYIKSLRKLNKRGERVIHKPCYSKRRVPSHPYIRRTYGIIIDIGEYYTVCGICGHKFPPRESINIDVIKRR